jgi:oligopeptidase A
MLTLFSAGSALRATSRALPFGPSSRVATRFRGGAAEASAATLDNPLLQQDSLPRFDTVAPENVTPAIEELLQRLDSEFTSLEGTLAAAEANVAYADVVEALERIEAPIEYAWGVVGHLMGVKNSDELRAAHGEMQPKVVQTTTKLSQSAAVYAAVEHVLSSAGALDESQRRILQSSLQGMKLSGVALEGSAKEQFNANRMELAELSTKFSNNVLDATKAWSMVVTDASQVDGLPPSAKALLASRAAADGADGATAEAGPWKLGLDMPAYLPAMKYIKDGAVREKLYRSFVTRAGAENEPLVRRILELKKEQAAILGYQTYAEVSIERKMAESVTAAAQFSAQLWAQRCAQFSGAILRRPRPAPP